ncbi:uncharacterized protein LOC128966381 [Oppia nitens]|uniref:uncharacterized protein LOC128966381 n=1 Tax=Oppia nitens TaxID=1686743 RepID=UPI0023D983E4|nr:uncharacterized protein LOC128966381 [Oppia nitens]
MRQDWILTDQEREVRRIKIEIKRAKKKQNKKYNKYMDISSNSSQDGIFSEETSNSSQVVCNITTNLIDNDINTTQHMIIDYIPEKLDSIININDDMSVTDKILAIESHNDKTSLIESDILSFKTISKTISKTMDETIQAIIPYKSQQIDFDINVDFELSIARQLFDYNNSLNSNELNRLNELLSATNHLQRQHISIVTEESYDFDTAIICLVNKCEKDIPELVKMCKSLRAFSHICESDKISLLKLGILEIILLRSVCTFDKNQNSWIVYEDQNKSTRIKLELWKTRSDGESLYYKHSKYLQEIHDTIDNDPVILDLLTTIMLFNPNRLHLKHKEAVKLQRYIYLHLLKRYLFLKYQSDCEVKIRLLTLMNNFKIIHELSKSHANHYVNDFIIKRISLPLLYEICAVKYS